MEDRIRQVMASVFGIDESDIADDASPDTITNWDSLGHMKLVLALEEEFNFQFNDDQIIELLNLKLIKLCVEECLDEK